MSIDRDVIQSSKDTWFTKHSNPNFAVDYTEVGHQNRRGFATMGDKISEFFDRTPHVIKKSFMQNPTHEGFMHAAQQSGEDYMGSIFPQVSGSAKEDGPRSKLNAPYSYGNSFCSRDSSASISSSMNAQSRWRRAIRSVTFINRLTASIRSAATDLIEDRAQQFVKDDSVRDGATVFKGAKNVASLRSTGRKRMEGLLVQQDRGFITIVQDFYVAGLKMPTGLFLVGVFFSPLILGLLFTPLYLLDVDGLGFNGIVPEDATINPLVSAKQRFLAFLNVFLYALSLSTTFGGAPVAAESPFCLLVANVNTLLAQFLFVFLSGAVFARMSRSSQLIRCSKNAIIKTDDRPPILELEQREKYKVLAVRLVLTGPSPCELVDAKVCLSVRIFVTLPSGSIFCSTHELELARSEVPYIRYGFMVRHVIDKKSPIYGHTLETLRKCDASFCLTVIGLEKTSMQSVFHVEDYFVCDDDVIWDSDFVDFTHINKRGQRVLDHSLIDLLKPIRYSDLASQAGVQAGNAANGQREGDGPRAESRHPFWHKKWPTLRKRSMYKTLSPFLSRANLGSRMT